MVERRVYGSRTKSGMTKKKNNVSARAYGVCALTSCTPDGVALHAGGVPGYRESHGCVHLPIALAKALYGVTDIGATVELRGTPPVDAVDAATTVAANDAGEAPATPPGVQLVSAHTP